MTDGAVPVRSVVPVRPRTGRIERRGAARGRARTTDRDAGETERSRESVDGGTKERSTFNAQR
jgi:hypothetical protein